MALDNKKHPYFESRRKCPACDSVDVRKLYSSPYDQSPLRGYLESFYANRGGVEFEYLSGASYTLCECCNCKLVFQREIPNERLMGRLYGKWIDPKKAHQNHLVTDNIELYSNYATEISTLIAYFDMAPAHLKFLDFGMGWAKWALMAKGFGCDSWGTEISKEHLENASFNGIKVVEQADIPQHQFDFINTEQVFEHLAQPLETLNHIKMGLKKSGILKISVPTANDLSRRLSIMNWSAPKGGKHSLNPVAPLEHINYFRRSSLIEMANHAGMEEVRIPITTQYRFTANWKGAKRVAKNIMNPLFRNIFKNRNHMFFRLSH